MKPSELHLLGSPDCYALARLRAVLTGKGIAWQAEPGHLIVGPRTRIAYGGPQAVGLLELLRSAGLEPPLAPESLLIKRVVRADGTLLILYGSDARGLAYAVHEAARAIELESTPSDPLQGIVEAVERPDLTIRSAIRTMMNRDLDVEWLHSQDFWERYLDMLVATRHNRLKLSIGWRSAYFSPPFPFLIAVPGYPHISVTNLSAEEREVNLANLQAVSAMAKDRGIEFYLDTYWMSHRPMGDWVEARKYVVEGLTDEVLPAYTRRGIRTLLQACPDIDGIGLSGSMVENGVEQEFMYALFDGIAECGRPMAIQIELKGVNQELVDQAVRRGIHVTLGGKYCMEHKGLPYHPAQVRLEELQSLVRRGWTRNSYADMLYRPRPHAFMFNLWNWGTQKVLLWGDPEDVAKMARNSLLSGSLGMEHGDPLTYKGSYSSGPAGGWRVLADSAMENYRWELERYWYHYLLYGRLMYSTHTSPEVWQREFRARFGAPAANHLIEALAHASRTTPLMTMVHAPSASDNAYWPEVYTNIPITFPDPARRDGGSTFGQCNPADTALFYRLENYVSDYLADRLSAKYDPVTVRKWFLEIGASALVALSAAECAIADPEQPEFRATRMDVTAQAQLALFFAEKLEAGVQFLFYRERGDFSALAQAIVAYERALEHWQKIIAVTAGHYEPNLAFHRNSVMSGTWADRIPAMVADLEQMKMLRENYLRQYANAEVSFAHVPSWVQHPPAVSIATSIKGWRQVRSASVWHRTSAASPYTRTELQSHPAAPPVFSAELSISPQASQLEYYLEAELRSGEGVFYPTSGPEGPLHVRLGPPAPAPLCHHRPVKRFLGGLPLRLELQVTSYAGLQSVKLCYRRVNQSEYVLQTEMAASDGTYSAEIPGTYTDSSYDLMYYFEVIDCMGNRVIYPGLNGPADAPYFVVERLC